MRLPGAAMGIATLLATAACSWQERMIFYPQRPGVAMPAAPAGYRIESLGLHMADGVRLEGWLVAPAAARPPVVIYFGGNAEEASRSVDDAPRYPGYALALVNYRGYGRSEGKPGEQALFSDALEVYDHLARRPDIDGSRIALHGRSLGSGVAVYLATQRPVRAIIVTTPFDSVRAIAEELFPWLPVGLILKHPFDSLSRAPNLKVPLLCLAAANDEVIPPHHARRLYEAWGGPKRWRPVTIPSRKRTTFGGPSRTS